MLINVVESAYLAMENREAQPIAGVIDGQTVKTTESGGVCGYDARKKIKGCKRHIVVDTIGLLFGLVVHAADIHGRDGAPGVLKSDPLCRSLAPACFRRRRLCGAETGRCTRQD